MSAAQPRLTKRHHPAADLVPKRQAERWSQVSDVKTASGRQRWVCRHRFGQAVEWDAAGRVVKVVRANVRRQPAQGLRKNEVRASLQRRGRGVPPVLTHPATALELVLHIEQSHPDGGGERHDRKVRDQHRAHPHERDKGRRQQSKSEVVAQDASPGPPLPHCSDRQSMLYEEHVGRPQSQHHEPVAIQSVAKALEGRERAILFHRQHLDGPQTSTVQVRGCRVMDGMGATPVAVGRHGEHANAATHPGVRRRAWQEGLVTAIVLYHEQPNEKCCGRWNKSQAPPPSSGDADIDSGPQRQQWNECDREFEEAARHARLLERREGGAQGLGVRGVQRASRSRRFASTTPLRSTRSGSADESRAIHQPQLRPRRRQGAPAGARTSGRGAAPANGSTSTFQR